MSSFILNEMQQSESIIGSVLTSAYTCVMQTFFKRQDLSPPRKFLHAPFQSIASLAHNPRGTSVQIYFLHKTVQLLACYKTLLKWHHIACTFYIWLLSLEMRFLIFVHVVLFISDSFFFVAEQYSFLDYLNLFFHPSC